MSSDPVIGIDLGTTFSAVAHINRHGAPELIANPEGARTTPSVVYFEEGGPPIVGNAARNVALSDPDRTVQFIKREMGNASFKLTFDGKEYLPESISALILRQLKSDAEARLGTEVRRAVISVPAYFKDSQKTATRTAGDLAGLEVAHTINEPTAAAIAYGLGKPDTRQTVLVYDFGGGTFDVTVLKVNENEFVVLSTHGDSRLGGVDVDDRLAAYLAEQFLAHRGQELRDDPFTRLDLWERAETAKRDLSTRQSVMVTLGTGSDALRVDLDRSRLAELIEDLVEKTRVCMDQALDEASLRWQEIDAVLLVGGSSRIAAVREMIKKVSGRELGFDVNPDEAVAAGAAIRGGLADLREGTEVRASSSAAPVAMSTVPEVGIVVRDVAPHSLGLRAFSADGKPINSIIVPRLTEVPCERTRTYATRADGQRRIEAEILQGENPDPYSPEVESIGRLVLDDLPERPAGEVLMTLTLRYDADGVVEVEAHELVGGKRVHQKLMRKSGELDDDALEQARRDLDDVGALMPPMTFAPPAADELNADEARPEAPPVPPSLDLYSFLGVEQSATTDAILSAIEDSEPFWQERRENADDSTDREVADVALGNLEAARTHLLDDTRRAAYDDRRGMDGAAPDESGNEA